MPIEVDRVRRDTPGCFGTVHLHHSGASLMPTPVLSAVKNHLDLELLHGGYEAEEINKDKLANTYSAIAKLLNCEADEVALMESATNAWNAVFYGIAQTFKPGDRILTAHSEYVSNMIAYLQVAERYGARVDVIPNKKYGKLDLRALENMIDSHVRLISITHVPTYNGLVNPIVEIGQVARDYGIPYLVDACQSAGQMPLDVQLIGCDALSATGRKYLRGPRGTGFLYVKKESLERFPPAILDLYSADWTEPGSFVIKPGSRRYEAFESNIAARIGLGAAVDYALSEGLHDIYARIRLLSGKLRHWLGQIPAITIRDRGTECCGIVTFSIDGMHALDFQKKMRTKNINVGVSLRNCAVIDFDEWGVDSIVRAPVHYINTEDELRFFIREVKNVVADFT